MPKPNDDLLTAYADHERTTAQRMQHWPVFLVREYRRLRAIADAVARRGEPAPSRMAVEPDGPIRRDSPSEPVPNKGKPEAPAELEATETDTVKHRREERPVEPEAGIGGLVEQPLPARSGRRVSLSRLPISQAQESQRKRRD